MKHSTDHDTNPYRSSNLRHDSGIHPTTLKPSIWLTLRPSRLESAFIFAVVGVSIYSHFLYQEMQTILHTLCTVDAIASETTLLALIGCGLTAIRYQAPFAKRITCAIAGGAVAAIVAVGTCFTLIHTGQPPNGLVLLTGVVAGMAVSALLMRINPMRFPLRSLVVFWTGVSAATAANLIGRRGVVVGAWANGGGKPLPFAPGTEIYGTVYGWPSVYRTVSGTGNPLAFAWWPLVFNLITLSFCVGIATILLFQLTRLINRRFNRRVGTLDTTD